VTQTAANPPAGAVRFWDRPGLRAALLLGLTLLVYWPSYRADFIWDDDVMVTANPMVQGGWPGLRDIWFSGKFLDYVPLTSTSFWVEWRLWGAARAGYHVTNVLLHALAALLLWRVLLRLRIPGAWVAALLFAVHPVCVTSVTWVAERKNTLSMVFYLLSLLCYLRFDDLASAPRTTHHAPRPSPSSFYLLSLLAFCLALCGKSSVVILPLVLLLCAGWRCPATLVTRRDLVRTAPFFLLAVGFGLITLSFHHRHEIGRTVELSADSLLARCLGAARAVWFYAANDLFPVHLTMHYRRWHIDPASPLAYLPALAVLAAFLLFLFCPRSLGKACLFGVGYFVLALAPALGVVNMAYLTLSQVADHLQYLALPGLIALIVGGCCHLRPHATRTTQRLSFLLHPSSFLLLLLPLSVLTWRYEQIVGHPEALWRQNIQRNPDSWPARNNLGRILAEQGKYSEAEAHCRRAVALEPTSAAAHYNLGLALFYQKQTDQALVEFARAVELMPTDSRAHNNLAITLLEKGKPDAALFHFREALRLDPANLEAHSSYAYALDQQGQRPAAAQEYLQVLRLQPGNAAAHNDLGIILMQTGQFDQALFHFQEAARLNPSSAGTWANLGMALLELDRLEPALLSLEDALALQPADTAIRAKLDEALARLAKQAEAATNSFPAHVVRAADFARQGNHAQAIAHWRQALLLRPDSTEVLNNLAWLLATSPEPQLRDGPEAVQLAQRACAANPRSFSFLDTLAAAYAEAGRFAEATSAVQQAITLAETVGQTNAVAGFRARCGLYAHNRPCRIP